MHAHLGINRLRSQEASKKYRNNCADQLRGSSVCPSAITEVKQHQTPSALPIAVDARWQGLGGCRPPLPEPLHPPTDLQRAPPSPGHLQRFWQRASLTASPSKHRQRPRVFCSAEARPYLSGAPAARRGPVDQRLAGAAAGSAAQGQDHLRLAGTQVGAPDGPAHRAYVGRLAVGTAGQGLGGGEGGAW